MITLVAAAYACISVADAEDHETAAAGDVHSTDIVDEVRPRRITLVVELRPRRMLLPNACCCSKLVPDKQVRC